MADLGPELESRVLPGSRCVYSIDISNVKLIHIKDEILLTYLRTRAYLGIQTKRALLFRVELVEKLIGSAACTHVTQNTNIDI